MDSRAGRRGRNGNLPRISCGQGSPRGAAGRVSGKKASRGGWMEVDEGPPELGGGASGRGSGRGFPGTSGDTRHTWGSAGRAGEKSC